MSDDQRGKEKVYSDAEFLDAIKKKVGEDSYVSTGAIANEVGCVKQTAQLRLDALEEEGRVSKLDLNNMHAWRVADSENGGDTGE